MSRCPQGANVPELVTKGKTTFMEKDPSREPSQKLQTHNVLTDDVENINSTNKGRDLLLTNKSWIVLLGTKRII